MRLDKCKSCGGDLERIGNYYVCTFCGSKWMIDADNDVHVIDRANAWSALRDCDFERSVELFENIIFKEPENHEAYWGRALASAGITYVTDLNENKRVPTCNSISEDSFIESNDVKKAIALAPDDLADTYRKQAEQIEAIRVEWLKKASKEKPYDVFICFKDSDREHGIDRTADSYDAQELYLALTEEGYRVFFSRVSLRNKISEQYEPYIYNAIKTAKVMIVFGEKPEYFNAVWVKNEWMRFRKRIEAGEKHPQSLVVVYKNLDPADMPAGLRSRQCLNAGDMTFLEDLKKHIRTIKQSTPNRKNGSATEQAPNISPLHEHVYYDEVIPATCVAKGYTIHKCQCGYEYRDSYTPLVDHKYKTVNEVAASCTADGKEDKICEVCGESTSKTIPALGHKYTKWIESKRPTCTEDGESQRQCTRCGHVEKNTVAKSGHRYGAWVTSSNGVQTRHCANCGHTQTKDSATGTYYFANINQENFVSAPIRNEENTISIKDIISNYARYWKSFFTSETTRAQKGVHFVGIVSLISFVIFMLTVFSNPVADDGAINITSPVTTVGLLISILSVPALIGVWIALGIERAKNGTSISRYSRTWLKGVSACLLMLGSIYLGVATLGNLGVAAVVMMAAISFIWAIIASIYAHCPKLCKNIAISKTKTIDKRVIAVIGAIATVCCFCAMITLIGLQPTNETDSTSETETVTETSSQESNTMDIHSVGVRSITLSDKYTAEFVLAQWESGIATEESLIDIMNEYGSNQGGGKLYIIERGEFVEEIDVWCFSADRRIGDYTIIENEYGYSICYISSINPDLSETEGQYTEETHTEAHTENDYGLEYTLNDDGQSYSVTGLGTCTDTDIMIPSMYKGKPVTSISGSAFAWCKNITSIHIPNSVTSIGGAAFIGCGLTSINIPDGVTSIGSSTFEDCKGLTSIEIPDSVIDIGYRAFNNCTKLERIIFNDNSQLTSIGGRAFEACMSLVSIDIPDGVTSIDDSTFADCWSLTNISIPSNVTSIDDGAFWACSALTYNEYDNALYLGNDNNPYLVLIKAKNTSITSCEINVDTKFILGYAFEGCFGLTSITIPDGVTRIGVWALYCSNLTSINFDGTTAQWRVISKGYNWDYYDGSYTIYCTDGTISK